MKPVIHEVYLNYQHEENIEKLALKFLSKPQQARDFTNKLENIIKPLKLFMITQIEKNKEINSSKTIKTLRK